MSEYKYHDVECPYCKAGNDINTDSLNYYVKENSVHSQTCDKCENVYSFTASLLICYDNVKQADCLNGGEHKWEETMTYPKEFTRLKCRDCGRSKPLSKERLEEIKNEKK